MRKNAYTADFETTVDLENTRVWSWALCEIKSNKISGKGTSIEQFFETIQDKNIDVFFHNLKFDGQFIITWLLENGFIHSDEKTAGTFNTLITDTNMFYKIEIIWSRHKKRYVKTVIYDSLKKLPFKVEVIAKAFNLSIKKGEIDYKKHRPIGYEPTHDEWEYLYNDVKIVAEALRIQNSQGLTRMTVGSDALGAFKDMIGKKDFKWFFPTLPYEIDKDIRRSYRGGWTFSQPKFRNGHHKGISFDVNSLYPYVMYYKLLPFGKPIFFKGEYEHKDAYPLYIQKIRCAFKIKEGKLPTVQLKNNSSFIPTQYLSSSNGDIVEMIMTSVDFELFKSHYDIQYIEYVSGYMFKATDKLFRGYIDYWSNIKATTTGAIRQLAKLMLNSLYGKFAKRTENYKKTPYMKDDGTVGYSLNDMEITEPVYTALASFVTAWARRETIMTAQDNYDRFMYADTDSIHLKGHDVPDGIRIHDTKLGYWKQEHIFDDSKFIRAKTYMEYVRVYDKKGKHTHNEWKITCAGMPDKMHSQVTWDNFTEGMEYKGKLRPKQVKGGVVLVETTFKISRTNT